MKSKQPLFEYLNYTFQYIETIDSTNNYLKNHISTLKHGHVLIANQQTNGRGTRGKTFISQPAVGLYLSILLKPNYPMKVSWITIISSVALHQTIKHCYHYDVAIKWLNDLLINQRKISGILVESIMNTTGDIQGIIVGIGVNLYSQTFPKDLNATSLQQALNIHVSKHKFINCLLQQFKICLLNMNHDDILQYYRKFCVSLNQPVYDKNRYLGEAFDINQDGALLIKKGTDITIFQAVP